jgi:hypothetical protein
MATGQSKPSALISRPTARDLSSYQYYAMKIDTNGDIDYGDSSGGAIVLGPLNDKPAAATGAEANIAVGGTALLIVNGTVNGGIAAGAFIGSNNAYKGVNVTGDDAFYFAIALEASTADGDIIEVLLVGPSYISGSGDD